MEPRQPAGTALVLWPSIVPANIGVVGRVLVLSPHLSSPDDLRWEFFIGPYSYFSPRGPWQ